MRQTEAPDEFMACNKKSENSKDFNPVSNHNYKKQAKHFKEIARFLAERTDDPKKGVGAVIVSQEMEVLSFGWNGFPLKAHYGEFARASKRNKTRDKKYPYIIHTEQNALLMRNTKSVEGAILFVTLTPCDECAPMIGMAGIKTVVVDDDDDVLSRDETSQNQPIKFVKFPKMVKKDKLFCYQTKKK